MDKAVQPPARSRRNLTWIALVFTVIAIAVITVLGPTERTLGENLRLVVLHGAWVWAGKLLFAAAAIAGLLGLAAAKGGVVQPVAGTGTNRTALLADPSAHVVDCSIAELGRHLWTNLVGAYLSPSVWSVYCCNWGCGCSTSRG